MRVPLKAAKEAAWTGDPLFRRSETFVPSKTVLICSTVS
jgi:hypothetical protein